MFTVTPSRGEVIARLRRGTAAIRTSSVVEGT
jgi:hypothetical protein